MAIVYRYMSAEGGLRTIEDGTLLLTNPSLFNDPFDANPSADPTNVAKAYRLLVNYAVFSSFAKTVLDAHKKGALKEQDEWAAQILMRFRSQMRKTMRYTRNLIVDFVVDHYRKTTPSIRDEYDHDKLKFESMIKEKASEMRSKLAICCFSASLDDILMWGHYGRSHTGVCIAFDIPDEQLIRVCYKKKRPSIDYKEFVSAACAAEFAGGDIAKDKSLREMIKKIYATKSLDWSYENEIRMIRFADEPEITRSKEDDNRYTVKVPTIKAIYLGAKISQKDKAGFYEKVDSSLIHEMIISDKGFTVSDSKVSNANGAR